MAVENQPLPAQPASPKLTMSRDFIQVIGAAAALAAVIIAGMALVVSMTVAPLREDMRSLRTEMQRGFEAVDSEFKAVRSEIGSVRGEVNGLRQDMNNEFKAVRSEITNLRQDMNNEFKAVRSDMADLHVRLTRVETLLERNAGQPAAPVAPDARQ